MLYNILIDFTIKSDRKGRSSSFLVLQQTDKGVIVNEISAPIPINNYGSLNQA